MPERMLQIGEFADRVGLSLRTVRFYDEQGLLTPAARSDGGFRLYTETQVQRLALIKRMKPLEFSVEQMRDLLTAHDLLEAPDATKADRVRAHQQIAAFADLATERCEELRKQFRNAEALAEQLQHEKARARDADSSG